MKDGYFCGAATNYTVKGTKENNLKTLIQWVKVADWCLLLADY